MTNTEIYALAYQALDELAEIAEARKAELGHDFVYRKTDREGSDLSCWYVSEDGSAPSCIVGVWLHEKKQVPLVELERREGRTALSVVSDVAELGRFDVDWDLLDAVINVQDEQDEGTSWSVAVANARAILDTRPRTRGILRVRVKREKS
ncbi:MAG: hypothetical protein WC054_00515 [Candidatus Nanopelagicales bacterium]